ncbi:MAG TPA: VanW family protein [Candidatus Angelobacter sp.]|nr:VanW family protein [Candidatus Angelobacter sp.]
MVQLDDVSEPRVGTRRQPAGPAQAERALPSRWQAALFVGKAWCFRTKRRLRDPAGSRPPRLERMPVARDAPGLALSQSPLYANEAAAEQPLQAGKVQNLRVAARYLDGLVIPAGETFSFWAQVPRPTRRLGFVRGRELREGCVIASVGGGLCQLSNALYDAALTAGCAIVERHAHSRRLPGSMAALGRDATIFWNYVDLRFRAPVDCQLEVALDRDKLTVALRALGAASTKSPPVARDLRAPELAPDDATGSCDSCGMTACFRNEPAPARLPASGAAWLVDAWWPEFDAYLRERAGPHDQLFTPLDSARLGIGPYRWNSAGFAAVRQAPWLVASRSWRSRRLARQGAARQRALLEMDEALARHYARSLPFAATHLVVSQTLLPFLWRDGVLGGRSFDVLMTRLPLADLQATLDRAARAWPQSPTLADFRADPALLEAESAALAAARRWITPHSHIAGLAGVKAEKLAWQLPPPGPAHASRGTSIAFPAGTLGRKGAYELRAVARELDLPLLLGGPVLEGEGFWDGVQVIAANGALLSDAAIVVLPAWLEDQPRRLLQAVATGVPIVASSACGVDGMAGMATVQAGDVSALRNAVEGARESR